MVLALIVAIVAISVPAMRTPLANYRLRSAADRICTLWIDARVKAMRNGSIHAFYYQPGGTAFRLGPWSQMAAGQTEPIAPAAPDATGFAGNTGAETGWREEVLREGIIFGLPETSEASARELTSRSETWSAPVLFFPDGTTSTARLLLSNNRRVVTVELRGLVGTSRVGPLQSIEEIAR